MEWLLLLIQLKPLTKIFFGGFIGEQNDGLVLPLLRLGERARLGISGRQRIHKPRSFAIAELDCLASVFKRELSIADLFVVASRLNPGDAVVGRGFLRIELYGVLKLCNRLFKLSLEF